MLHLAGVVRVVEGALRVRNRIYFAGFDQDWIKVHLPPTTRPRQWASAARWDAAMAASKA